MSQPRPAGAPGRAAVPSGRPPSALSGHPFVLDDFQVQALASLDAGRSVLVAAPTGAGKTVVAEHAVALALAAGRRVFYTTPIKALSNQKFGDLARRHGPHRVGLLTGDNAINGDAPVVITTTGASPLMALSPVRRPTRCAPWRRARSPNFWFDSALIGVV